MLKNWYIFCLPNFQKTEITFSKLDWMFLRAPPGFPQKLYVHICIFHGLSISPPCGLWYQLSTVGAVCVTCDWSVISG